MPYQNVPIQEDDKSKGRGLTCSLSYLISIRIASARVKFGLSAVADEAELCYPSGCGLRLRGKQGRFQEEKVTCDW